jgi:hypothetical protein
LDRYTNGESEIKIDKIDYGIVNSVVNHDIIKDYLENNIPSIIKTSDVTWLKSEESIKKIRKQKLEQLKQIISN